MTPKPKPHRPRARQSQIKATANLKAGTVRIEVLVAGSLDVIWLDREEVSNFISELKVAHKAVVAGIPATGTDSRPVEDGNL